MANLDPSASARQLRCLLEVADVLRESEAPLDEMFRQVVALLPSAWEGAHSVGARIIYDGRETATPAFRATPWRMESDIIVSGQKRGTLEVARLEGPPPAEDDECCRQARHMVEVIAGRLGKVIQARQAEEALARSRAAVARGQQLLLALSRASEAVQRAATPAEVHRTVLDEVQKLGHHALVFTLTPDREHLALSYMTIQSPLIRTAERLARRSAQDYRAQVQPGGILYQVLASGEAVFTDDMATQLAATVPGLSRALARRMASVLGIEQGIYAPLVVEGVAAGLLLVTGRGLTVEDVPAVATFAGQIGIALERTRLLEALRESEERFRGISAAARDAIVLVDSEGKVVFWNPAAEQMFGYTAEEARGLNAHRLLAPQRFGAGHPTGFEEFAASGQGLPIGRTVELTATSRDGTPLPVELSVSALELRGVWHAVAICRDIRERKRAEQELQASEARYRSLFEGVPVGLYRSTPEGVLLDANSALVDMLGYPDRETLLAAGSVAFYADPADRQRWRAEIEAQGVLRGFEAQLKRADGSLIWTLDTARAVVDADGRLLYYEGSLEDITARKRAEEALRQYAAELEQRNEELDAFAHTVAHDLKGPLNSVIGMADVLAQEYDNLDQMTVSSFLRMIANSGWKMAHIIDALLLLSSVRKMEMVPVEPLDMAQVVHEARMRLQPLADEQGAEIVLPERWPAAVGYAPWVEEVWANYISNAIKYGGEPPRVELGADPVSYTHLTLPTIYSV